MQMYKAVRAARLYEQIVQQIEQSIVEGKLSPGDQLPTERELAQQFGVSRTAVREAVKTLTEKGWWSRFPGGYICHRAEVAELAEVSGRIFRDGGSGGSGESVELREIIEPRLRSWPRRGLKSSSWR